MVLYTCMPGFRQSHTWYSDFKNIVCIYYVWLGACSKNKAGSTETVHRSLEIMLMVLYQCVCFILFAADNIFLKPDSFKIGLGDFGLSRRGKCPPRLNPTGGQ